MKHFLKISVTFILVAILLFCVACSSKKQNETAEKTLFSFDSYDELLGNVSITLSKAELCSDKNYVKEGSNSLHVKVQGEYASYNVNPNMIVYTDGESFNKGDFSIYDFISVDIYNDNEEEKHIDFWLKAYDNFSSVISTKPLRYTLKPMEWNKIVYDFSDGGMKKQLANLSQVVSMCFSFCEYKQSKNDPLNSFYIDNITGGILGTQKELQLNKQPNEIFYFEDLTDINLIGVNSDNPVYFLPRISLNTNKTFVTQGENSLRIDCKNAVNTNMKSTNTESYYYQLKMDLNILPKSDNATSIKFDIINANDKIVPLNVEYLKTGGSEEVKVYYLTPNDICTVVIEESEIDFLKLRINSCIMADEKTSLTFYLDNIRYE